MGCGPTKDSSKPINASKDAKDKNKEDEEQKVPLEEGESNEYMNEEEVKQEQDKAESDIDRKSDQERKKSENESSKESRENSREDIIAEIPALAEALGNKLEEQKEDGELVSSAVARPPTDIEQRLGDDNGGLISSIVDCDIEGSAIYPVTRLDKSSFVYHTKAPDLVEGINSIIQNYQAVDENGVSALNPSLLKVDKAVKNLHQRFHGAIVNHRWKLYDKGSTWEEYIMPLEQVISTKTVARLPITPIEVSFILIK
eukprot:TRINITY_DN12740_c0_g1_i9.p1 TRINITY_DN12740_c0_g1~~TRINITY_DN12740_c0_g1_i9.p1  ORF type:complete len:257 (-),score=45.93 TRINITY_DN12740_c0_g1_i9:601-1371(-)